MNARHIVVFLLALFLSCTAHAQVIDASVVAVSGGFAETGTVSVAWTVGQTAVESRRAYAGTLNEGFQQAYLSVIPIREHSIPFSLDLYPNPARTSVLVNMTGIEEDMSLVLYNLLGEEVMRRNVRSGEQMTRLPFTTLPGGLYMLVAFTGSGEQLGLYKIVKAQ